MKKTTSVPLAMLLCFGLAAGTDAASSRIYRTVDEDGNVVFTDIPPREDEKSEQIRVIQPNSFVSEEAVGSREDWIVDEDGSTEGDAEANGEPFSYNSLVIKSPQDDAPVRENAGNVTVVAVAHPRLQIDHRMRLLFNGQPLQEGYQSDFSLENVDRGTHSIATEIIDAQGRVLIRSGTSTFHLLRASR